MAAIGALIQTTLAGQPLGLLAINIIGVAVRLDLNLNFEPAVSTKEPAVPSWGGLDSVAGLSSPFSYTKVLSAVVLPAAFSVIEPYLFSADNDFGSCGQQDSSASSSGPSSAGGNGGMRNRRRGTSVGQGSNCPQGQSNARCGRSASGRGRRGGNDGNNNGDGNNVSAVPPPTRTSKNAPKTTTAPARPMAGGAPPPPPPPPPYGSGGSLDDKKDRTQSQDWFDISMIVLAGLILGPILDHFVNRFDHRLWYSGFRARVRLFARRMRRATRFRYLRSVLASGRWKVCQMVCPQCSLVPHQLAMQNHTADDITMEVSLPFRGEYITKDLALWNTPATDLALWNPTATDLVVWVSLACPYPVHEPATVQIFKDLLEQFVVDEFVFVQPHLVDEIPVIEPVSVSRVVEILLKVVIDIIARAYAIVNGFLILDAIPKILLVTLIGLLSYYHMLIQAVDIVHLGQGGGARSVMRPQITSNHDKVPLSEHIKEDGSLEENVSKEDDAVEGVHASMHFPLDQGSLPLSVPTPAPVEHQGGIPVTEMEFRPGYRTRRRKRCRKKKGSKLAATADAVESSTLNEDQDSRSLASSMCAT